jgi:hypothetical protein
MGLDGPLAVTICIAAYRYILSAVLYAVVKPRWTRVPSDNGIPVLEYLTQTGEYLVSSRLWCTIESPAAPFHLQAKSCPAWCVFHARWAPLIKPQPVLGHHPKTFQSHAWFMLQADDNLEPLPFCSRRTGMRTASCTVLGWLGPQVLPQTTPTPRSTRSMSRRRCRGPTRGPYVRCAGVSVNSHCMTASS